MATATATKPKTTARKPAAKPQPKSAARKTQSTAKATAKTAAQKTQTKTQTKTVKTAAKPAQERTVKNIVVDTAYATVGITDTAVEVLKSLPAKAAELREEAPVRVRTLTTDAPKQLTERFQAVTTQGKATVTGLRGTVETQIDSYASRGREVIGKVQNSAATKRALEQSRVARAQVKAAATSVRKAVGATADAAEVAAEKAGTVAAR